MILTDSDLAELRALEEGEMTSRVNVRRRSKATQDEDTGREISWRTVHTSLPFHLLAGRSHTITVGGVVFEEATAVGKMPAATLDLADRDLLEVTAGEWAGTVWQIVEAVKGDRRTARRVPVVETARPPEWTP